MINALFLFMSTGRGGGVGAGAIGGVADKDGPAALATWIKPIASNAIAIPRPTPPSLLNSACC